MAGYLAKWTAAALVMPILVFFVGKFLNLVCILVFWPGAFLLMSLGAGSRPLAGVLYVWAVGIGSNVLLYVAIGLLVRFLLRNIDR